MTVYLPLCSIKYTIFVTNNSELQVQHRIYRTKISRFVICTVIKWRTHRSKVNKKKTFNLWWRPYLEEVFGAKNDVGFHVPSGRLVSSFFLVWRIAATYLSWIQWVRCLRVFSKRPLQKTAVYSIDLCNIRWTIFVLWRIHDRITILMYFMNASFRY